MHVQTIRDDHFTALTTDLKMPVLEVVLSVSHAIA